MTGTRSPTAATAHTSGRRPVVDLRDPVEADRAFRISLAWRELRRGSSASALRDYLFGIGDGAIEPGQMDALDVLLTRECWRMAEFAEALRVDPSTATRTAQRLVNAGLAIRRTPADDGRVVLVGASPEGRRRHRAVAKRRTAALSRLLAEFSPDEREQLADLLGRFVGALDVLVDQLGDDPATPGTNR